MKHLALILSLLASPLAAESLTVPGRWSEEKANQWYDTQPWLFGCNFTPSTAINQLEMWQAATFDPETIDRELGWAAGLGMNTVRVYLHDLLWEQDAAGFLERIDRFLGIADKHGIRTMFVIFDSCWGSFPKLGEQPAPRPHVHNSGWVQSPHIDTLKDVSKHKKLEPYVKGVIGRFKDDARVLAWDLYNEPGAGSSSDGMRHRHKLALCMILLEHAFEWARAAAPSQPLTIGLYGGEWIGPKSTRFTRYVLENADVLSFHDYRELHLTIERVGTLKPFGRPILCTEYMARGAYSRFETHLPYFRKNRIAAYNWGLVAGKTQTQYPWSSWQEKFTAEPELWHHDILRPDGTPFDPAEVRLFRALMESR
ncbi:MAG: endo-1,4-beta-xylanase [Luteolibacter sp.]